MERMMIDVSEVKSKRECGRKWAFSSRNKMHLRAKEVGLPLRMGTAFHKAVERMYLGVDVQFSEIVDEYEIDDKNAEMFRFNLGGYANNVVANDLKKFAVVNTEHRFNIPIEEIEPNLVGKPIMVVGSIDLVYRDRVTGLHGGLEHKYLKNFRPEVYEQLDEQPKLYTYAIAHDFGECTQIGLNQIRKLKTKFDHARTQMSYTDAQMSNFIEGFLQTAVQIANDITNNVSNFRAEPSYMGCGMCDYAPLCLHMNACGTDDINIITEEHLEQVGLAPRLIDHLEEK